MDHRPAVEALLTEFGVGTEWQALSDADSFTILSFVLELEKRVGVPLPPTDLIPTNFASVDSIVGMLARAAPG